MTSLGRSSPARRPGSSAGRCATSCSAARWSISTSPVAIPRAAARAYANALGRRAVSALRASRSLARRARRRADGRLHAAPGRHRGRPGHAGLHDQRDRRAARRRRAGGSLRRARRPRARVAPRRLAERVRGRPAAASARRADRGRARLPDGCGDGAARPRARRARRPGPRASGSTPSWCASRRRVSARRRARAAGAARRVERGPRPRASWSIARTFGSSPSSATRSPTCRFPTSSGATRARCFGAERPRTDRRARSIASAARPSRGRSTRSPSSAPSELADSGRDARAARPRRAAAPRRRARPAQGPEVGRLLELVDEERAAGTISTREEALELVKRELGSG